MGKFGNINLLICQCSGMGKVIDAEKMQKVENILIESFKAYQESERQIKISEELRKKAFDLIFGENVRDIDIEEIFKHVKRTVFNEKG